MSTTLSTAPAVAPLAGDRPVRPRSWSASSVGVLFGCAGSAAAIVWLLFALTPLAGGLAYAISWLALFVAIFWLVERDLHGKLAASDRTAQVLIAASAAVVVGPLVTIVGYVVYRGLRALRPGFFIHTMASVGPLAPASQGGAAHAIVGTLMQVTLALVVSVPIGVLAAVFLNEIGGRIARPVRALVNAMSGVPSIVAGLFIYAVWIIQFRQRFSGFAGGLALSVLMLPTVIRTAEEVLRLVPDGLREASLALGVPQWRTVMGVVLPTARAGLITAVILGVARAVGETAPLIMTSFGSSTMNWDPFRAPQASLPLYIFQLIRSPFAQQLDRAWTGAFVLIFMVLALFTAARLFGRGRRGGRKKRPNEPPAVAG
jgi:phosphate transport system permease protein